MSSFVLPRRRVMMLQVLTANWEAHYEITKSAFSMEAETMRQAFLSTAASH